MVPPHHRTPRYRSIREHPGSQRATLGRQFQKHIPILVSSAGTETRQGHCRPRGAGPAAARGRPLSPGSPSGQPRRCERPAEGGCGPRRTMFGNHGGTSAVQLLKGNSGVAFLQAADLLLCFQKQATSRFRLNNSGGNDPKKKLTPQQDQQAGKTESLQNPGRCSPACGAPSPVPFPGCGLAAEGALDGAVQRRRTAPAPTPARPTTHPSTSAFTSSQHTKHALNA